MERNGLRNIRFRLLKFKKISRWLDKHLPAAISYFLKGWLYGLETSYIASKASSAVEKGIEPFKPLDPIVEPPRYHSEPSEVEGLNIIQKSAPWSNNNNHNHESKIHH